jgi:hypothetical protein
VIRLATFVTCLVLAFVAMTPAGFAQQHGGGRPEARGGRYPPPAPGGRYAGPYGYAYRAGAYPNYPRAPLYPGPAYPPPFVAPPRARAPNSLGADWRLQQEEARSGVRQGQFAPLGRVIAEIGRRAPGRQLDAGIEYDGGRAVYRVRWITLRGRRMDFLVDAASGAIIGER